jgi:hypothetical protein
VPNRFGRHVARYPDPACAGFNPLAFLDPAARSFDDGAARLRVERDVQRHFPESARGLVTAAMMWKRTLHGPQVSLQSVCMMLTKREQSVDVRRSSHRALARMPERPPALIGADAEPGLRGPRRDRRVFRRATSHRDELPPGSATLRLP